MPVNKINHPAALLAAVVYFLTGWVWFAIFGARWLDLLHKTAADMNPQDPVPYVVSFAMGIVVAYATAIALRKDERPDPAGGARFGALVGLAFVASTMLTNNLYEGRPVALWLIDAGYPVFGMVIVGAIVGGWKRKPERSDP
jgi:hypothetical protein